MVPRPLSRVPGPATLVAVDSKEIKASQLPGHLAGLSLPRQVVALAIWPFIEQMMAVLVGTVDMVIAGHLRPQSLAVAAVDALGVTGYVTWLMALVYSSVGVGAAALIARAIGGRHRRLAHASLGQAMVMAAVCGAAVGTLMYASARPVGLIAGLDSEGLHWSTVYLRIVAYACLPCALLLIGNAALRAAGDMRTPCAIMAIVNVANIVLSLLFVYGPTPIGGHGVAGIAAGTLCAWVIGALVTLTVLTHGWGGLRLFLHRLRPHHHTMQRIVRVAVPNLSEAVGGMWLGNFMILTVVGRLAQDATLGAHMIVIRIESVSFLGGVALGVAASTLTGQYLGAGDAKRARSAAHLATGIAAAYMGVCGLFYLLIPTQLVRLLTDAEPLIRQAPDVLRICGPIQAFMGVMIVLSQALRGAGDTRAPMWITTLCIFLVRVPGCYVLGVTMGLGLPGIWFALCGEMTLRALIFIWRFRQGRWARIKV